MKRSARITDLLAQLEPYIWTGNQYGVETSVWDWTVTAYTAAHNGDTDDMTLRRLEAGLKAIQAGYLYEFEHDEVIDVPDGKDKDSEGRWKYWKSIHRKVARWRSNVRENLRGPG